MPSGITKAVIHSTLLLAAFIIAADCYPSYQTLIPNGVNVPDPCRTVMHTFWPGVGHQISAGGGARNPFGTAFAAAQNVSDSIA
jgi:hypothetical protein